LGGVEPRVREKNKFWERGGGGPQITLRGTGHTKTYPGKKNQIGEGKIAQERKEEKLERGDPREKKYGKKCGPCSGKKEKIQTNNGNRERGKLGEKRPKGPPRGRGVRKTNLFKVCAEGKDTLTTSAFLGGTAENGKEALKGGARQRKGKK